MVDYEIESSFKRAILIILLMNVIFILLLVLRSYVGGVPPVVVKLANNYDIPFLLEID